MPMNITYQQGFTLVELMISLVLGLLISAAVIQVFVTSQRVDRIQNAGSEIQDSAVFGLQSIEKQLRLANLGNDGVSLNDKTALGGIVLTSSNNNASVNVLTKNEIGGAFLTRSHDMSSSGKNSNSWNGLTNTNNPSDQLTIQYSNTTGQILQDCEGKNVTLDERVITRYFIVEDSSNTTGKNRKNLNLNCDAGRIANDGTLSNFTDVGQTVIRNVDQFNIRLGVKQKVDTNGVSRYEYTDMSVKDYMDMTTEKPFITNIKIAVLTRSNSNSPDDSNSKFTIFGIEQELKEQANAPKYLRRVYETNVLLRNARIVNVINSAN